MSWVVGVLLILALSLMPVQVEPEGTKGSIKIQTGTEGTKVDAQFVIPTESENIKAVIGIGNPADEE